MSLLTNNNNSKTSILDITILRKNLDYILRFKLLIKVIQYINLCLIFYDIYINKPTIVLDIKLNLYIFNYLKIYLFTLNFIINLILKVFY